MELNRQDWLNNYNFYKEYYREFYNKDIDSILKQDAMTIKILKDMKDERELKQFIKMQQVGFSKLFSKY